jgi:hypothetical protein
MGFRSDGVLLRTTVVAMVGGGGAEGAQHEQAMEMLRADYRPTRWTRTVWARFLLAFTPLIVAAVLALLLSR